ncbi:hypothetical protein, partial [Pseudomonas sp. FG-3G]
VGASLVGAKLARDGGSIVDTQVECDGLIASKLCSHRYSHRYSSFEPANM